MIFCIPRFFLLEFLHQHKLNECMLFSWVELSAFLIIPLIYFQFCFCFCFQFLLIISNSVMGYLAHKVAIPGEGDRS